MDRHSPRIIRGAAAAAVSVLLFAGAAFAANTVMGPPSVGPDFAPAAAASAALGASKVTEPTGTAEPTEAARSVRSAEPSETAEPSEAPKAAETAGRIETPETNGDGGHGGSSHDHGGSDQGGNG